MTKDLYFWLGQDAETFETTLEEVSKNEFDDNQCRCRKSRKDFLDVNVDRD